MKTWLLVWCPYIYLSDFCVSCAPRTLISWEDCKQNAKTLQIYLKCQNHIWGWWARCTEKWTLDHQLIFNLLFRYCQFHHYNQWFSKTMRTWQCYHRLRVVGSHTSNTFHIPLIQTNSHSQLHLSHTTPRLYWKISPNSNITWTTFTEISRLYTYNTQVSKYT
jgi:hypothetical protein